MTIRVYIAAAKSQQTRAERRAEWHRDRGHVVTSTWHSHPVADVDPADRDERERIAVRCIREIDGSDWFELLAGGDPRGALFEFGYASARGGQPSCFVERGCPTLFDALCPSMDPEWDSLAGYATSEAIMRNDPTGQGRRR